MEKSSSGKLVCQRGQIINSKESETIHCVVVYCNEDVRDMELLVMV